MVRTIEQAEQIIRNNGASSWAELDDEDKLGCSREEHEAWLTTAPEADLIGWAKSVACDEEN